MFAVALALDFDVYVLDGDLPTIQPRFAASYQEAWEERLKNSNVLIAASKPPRLSDHCAQAFILEGGQLSPAMPMQRATRVFREKMRSLRATEHN